MIDGTLVLNVQERVRGPHSAAIHDVYQFKLGIDSRRMDLSQNVFVESLAHGGDSAAPDMLLGNRQIVSFAPNQWVYRTMALPTQNNTRPLLSKVRLLE